MGIGVSAKRKEMIVLKWLQIVKQIFYGSFQRNKTILVAKGYAQQPDVDFNEIFTPVSQLDTIRQLIVAGKKRGWMHQLDVKPLFLNGELEEPL